jgi:hypothetical protein
VSVDPSEQPFPVDDATLLAVEHALTGAFTVDPDGTHHLVGAVYALNVLLAVLGLFLIAQGLL